MTAKSRPGSVKVGVGAIIVAGDEILLIRRAQTHGRGTWSTPGGYLRPGERLDDCARREAREEVGVELADMQFVAVTNDLFQDGRHCLTVWMASRLPDAKSVEINPNGEVAAHGWFRVEHLPSPLFLPFSNLLRGNGYPPRTKEEGIFGAPPS
jgi:8-oxo-dGTP diphosphatase